MQLNLSTDIALRTLIYLGKKEAPATIAEVAEAYAIAKTHLMKVVMALSAANLVSSERGRTGGIRLAKNARDISVGSVVRLMENNLALLSCMKKDAGNEVCPLMPDCRLRKLLFKAQQAFITTLDDRSLAELL